MPIFPEWNPPKKKPASNTEGSGDSGPHDDPAPYDGVEDEEEDVTDDPRRVQANDDQKEPEDDDEEVWSSSD